MTATAFAAATRIFDTAQADHQAAADKAESIRDRIAAAGLRQSEITTRRINGTSSPAETAEFGALAGDVDLLRAMLASADLEVAAKTATMHTARDALTYATEQHARGQTRIEFDALKVQAEQLESAFCDCIAALHQRGQKLGYVSLVMSFNPTIRLKNIVAGHRP